MGFRQKIIALLCVAAFAAMTWLAVMHVRKALRIAHPIPDVNSLPKRLIELDSSRGQMLLKYSLLKADYDLLTRYYEPQIYRSYCGVASGVISVNALKQQKMLSQSSFFDGRPDRLRSSYRTFFGGMTLQDFKLLVGSHHLLTEHLHGGTFSLDEFRSRVKQNLLNNYDLLVVNYQRKRLGQKGGGHFSPLAAYHGPSDHVLILDVAQHRYPSVWVPLEMLWHAMNTHDSDSGLTRGFVEISTRMPTEL